MRTNRRLRSFLPCLAIALVFVLAQQILGKEANSSKDSTEKNAVKKPLHDPNTVKAKNRLVVVYYFHGNVRCHTCKRIEKLTWEAIREAFWHELDAGVIQMKAINVDEGNNKHFTKDYQLFTRSVIVSDMVAGKEKRWKNLQRVWELVRDDQAFKEYIQTELKAYLL